MERVAVFIDYQNVYEGARRAFFERHDPYVKGQVDPIRLGTYITALGGPHRMLDRVRVYRGQPESTKQPKAYAANRRQLAAWNRAGVEVVKRTLRYPYNWPTDRAEEKGIDVALAIDFVMMAYRNEYDVGVLFSCDTDLKPALEAVRSMTGGPRVEVAAWQYLYGHSPRLSVKGTPALWCHWLDSAAHHACEDPVDYTRT
jgi:uncharacterized LabA/DUF88 family protein